jgi:hypothetical protein
MKWLCAMSWSHSGIRIVSTISRQRLGKNFPEVTLSKIRTFVAGYRNDKHAAITIHDKNERCFLMWSSPRLFPRQLRGNTPLQQ